MFFLVTGASGVGKTTVRKLIEAEIHKWRPGEMRWHSWNSDEVVRVHWTSRIVDTTHLNPTEVAGQVRSWIAQYRRVQTVPVTRPQHSGGRL